MSIAVMTLRVERLDAPLITDKEVEVDQINRNREKLVERLEARS